jgi:tetratricopeptide (TPR) repeat protein
MKARSIVIGVGAVVLLAAGGAGALLYAGGRRDVTTSSREAARHYREALENERGYYFKEARLGYARALELDPEFAEAMLGLARQSTDPEQAAALVQKAARQTDRLTERERLHVAMELARVERRRDDVIRIAGEIHAKHPDDVRAAMMLASRELLLGKPDGAIRIYEDVLAVDPNNAEAYNQIGYLYAWRGEMDKAIANLKKYQFMRPGAANPYDSLGEVQAYAGRYDEAIANLNEAIKIKADFHESWGHMGVAYEGKGEPARAIACYEKAADLADNDAKRGDYLGMAARVAFWTKDRAKLEELAARMGKLPKTPYTEMDKDLVTAAVALVSGRPAEALGPLSEARSKWELAVAKERPPANWVPDWPDWNLVSALAYVALHKDSEAMPFLERLATPPNPYRNLPEERCAFEGRALLAAALARKGDLDRAEKLLDQNRKQNPSWAPTKELELSVAQARREKVLAATK